MIVPPPAAARTGLRHREAALVTGDDATAVTVRAHLGRRARLGAAAMARVAGVRLLDRHARRDAVQRVVERDGDVHLQVGAALGRLLAAAAGPPAPAEEAAEEVAQVAHVELGVALAEHAAGRSPGPPAPGRKPPPAPGPKAPSRLSSSYCLRFSGSESVS